MNQIYNGNTKRPKPKEDRLGILGVSSRQFTHFPGNSLLGPGESTAGTMYLSLRIHPKNCYIFSLKLTQLYLAVKGRAQLEHSNHIVKVGVKATC